MQIVCGFYAQLVRFCASRRRFPSWRASDSFGDKCLLIKEVNYHNAAEIEQAGIGFASRLRPAALTTCTWSLSRASSGENDLPFAIASGAIRRLARPTRNSNKNSLRSSAMTVMPTPKQKRTSSGPSFKEFCLKVTHIFALWGSIATMKVRTRRIRPCLATRREICWRTEQRLGKSEEVSGPSAAH
jgi:hypothetical protein